MASTLRVREVMGQSAAAVGERVVYRVTEYNEPNPSSADTAAVSWLVKSTNGAALAHAVEVGPVLDIVVPAVWGGQTAFAMPYIRSPSMAIAVRTEYAPAARPLLTAGTARTFAVVRENSRFYVSTDGEPRFFLGKRVRYRGRVGDLPSFFGPLMA